MRVTVPRSAAYIAWFLVLAFLCYQAHQLTRHLVGAALCGGFGTMTFTDAVTRQPCTLPTIITLSGPVLTYGLAYLGMALLRSRRLSLFAYTLIFASFSHLRWIQNLTGRGDELVLAEQWFGMDNRLIVALVVFLIGLPPIIAAYRAIANDRRNLVFLGSYLLPLPVLFVQLFGNKYLFETTQTGTSFGSILGIWLTVLITDLLALLIWFLMAPKFLKSLFTR